MPFPVHTTSNLRLEVESAPPGLPNIFPDPDGVKGTWPLKPFYVDSASEPYLASDGTAFTIQNLASGDYWSDFLTSYLPVPAASYIRVRFEVIAITAGHQLVPGFVYWADANKQVFTTSIFTTTGAGGAVGVTYSQLSLQAPAGAVYMAVQYRLVKGSSAPDLYAAAAFKQMMITYAPTAAALSGSFAHQPPITWANILGPTHSIKINREALDVGTLSATVTSALLDPAISGTLALGKAVRAQALVGGVWESLFEGRITDADVTYSRGRLGEIRTNIRLEAADNIAALANTPEDAIYATPEMLPKIIEWAAPVPFKINGNISHWRNPSGYKPSGYEPDGTILSSIAITRDSVLGYAFVDRKNVFVAYDASSLPSAVQCAFTDVATADAGSDYYLDSDLAVGFSADELINQLSITFLKRTGTVEPAPTTEVNYGPYSDIASFTRYGSRSATFKIVSNVETTASMYAYANTVFTRNKTPQRRATALTMPVRDTRSMGHAAVLDLYDKTTVTFSTLLSASVCRITSIEHTIETDRWSVRYGFSSDVAVAMPR